MISRSIERDISRHFKLDLSLVSQSDRTDTYSLSRAEFNHLTTFLSEVRQSEWMLGRRLLKHLLNLLNRNDTTDNLSFPHPQLSLTHSENAAFAVGTNAGIDGLGIDYERVRAVKPQTGKWFLTDRELSWLMNLPETTRPFHIIRLWTVKEAAYKSYPGNAHVTFREFEINNPESDVTTVFVTRNKTFIENVSCFVDGGYLSICVNRGRI